MSLFVVGGLALLPHSALAYTQVYPASVSSSGAITFLATSSYPSDVNLMSFFPNSNCTGGSSSSASGGLEESLNTFFTDRFGSDNLDDLVSPVVDGTWYMCAGNSGGYLYQMIFYRVGGDWSSSPVALTDTSTHFISTTPILNDTVSTTTTVGADLYVNSKDVSGPSYGRLIGTFVQESAFACENSGAVLDALTKCTGSFAPTQPFSIDFNPSDSSRLIVAEYNESTSTTFGAAGKWDATYSIQQISYPWYFLYLQAVYTTILSTTTSFIVSTTSPMDIARGNIQTAQAALASSTGLDIGAILASTTASIGSACNLIYGGNMGNCLTLMVWPGDQVLNDDALLMENLPPWGYAIRFYNILSATTTSSTLPVIDYTFASSSPLSTTIGEISFDPLGDIQQSATLIDSWQSDHGGGNVFQIMEPIIKIVIYLALFLEMGRELLGFDWGGERSKRRDRNE
jgi:hypothetical protein